MSDVTSPPPPVTEPDPSAARAPGMVGPCAGCQRPTHKYGAGGRPLCQWCMDPVVARYGSTVRYVSAR
ncbi:hypothetical protein Shyhy01_74050 [Streptomyces hygroscopicus subsp. hygroscopicus]|nr:hypothetical protein Shyhy01_74050 [Streptomyces hygroscopicus subsp. hygroscopicus]